MLTDPEYLNLILRAGTLAILTSIAIMLTIALPVRAHATSPRACTFDGGGTLASGDAGQTSDGRIWVCTDGTLVHVTSYGNR